MQGSVTPQDDITPGFMLVQGNRMEALRALLIQWLRQQPLQPLEDETFLVQSNGIAQWLRLALAAPVPEGGCGIAAALDIKLPGKFVWQAYRAVLGDLPETSPYDKAPLTWRLYRLLGDLDALASTPEEHQWLQPLRGFLASAHEVPASGNAARRRFQLAERLADLYDQYQVFRADWLTAWQQGHDQLPNGSGDASPLPEEQRWQPLLWRRITADTAKDAQGAPGLDSRSALHARFLAQAEALTLADRPDALPRRIVVFGISSLPRQVIKVLKAVSHLCQVVLFVHNPCQHYWGDIVEGRELFRQHYRRLGARKVPEGLAETDLHLHGHPLLAAWGRQGRDYIRLLDEFDEAERYREDLAQQGLKIDLFEQPEAEHLLAQIQHDILDLVPLQERRAISHPEANGATTETGAAPATPLDAHQDRSIEFLIAHSPQREVEILHDQLLAAFAEADAQGDPLAPRDILVMVPDIATYAPHIQAVFGQFVRDDGQRDRRHIPYHIADQGQRQRHPLLVGLEHLLRLPQARFSVTELLDLLDIPALRARFDLDEAHVPGLRAWIRGANIRWGLHGVQRAAMGLPDERERTTWRFGLQRMLLGFAAGDAGAWKSIEPHAAVRGLEAERVGALHDLLSTLEHYWQSMQQTRTPQAWAALISALLDDIFRADTSAEQNLLLRLREALEGWVAESELAGAGKEALPLEVVSDALMPSLDSPTLSQRFLAGAVNFATLMPMRAIPFRQIWLLGMNDGDYPRSRRPADFDLMGLQVRPGDRSRREDDRYLFLEALLSARDKLGISWVGRSIQDDSELPPSVLVGQLRDHIEAGWGKEVLKALTTQHPLQPFSPKYFNDQPSTRLFTYAGEWRAVHGAAADDASGAGDATEAVDPTKAEAATEADAAELGKATLEDAVNLTSLGDWLRHPLRHVYQQRLSVYLNTDEEKVEDDEPFHFDSLGTWALHDQALRLVEPGLIRDPQADMAALLATAVDQLVDRGELPLTPFDTPWAEAIMEDLAPALADYAKHLAQHPETQPAHEVRIDLEDIRLFDRLEQVRCSPDADERLILRLSASKVIKQAKVQWHNLVRHWPMHLAAQLQAPTQTRLIGPTGAVCLHPLDAADAREHLKALMQTYLRTLSRLPPLACKTAFAWLSEDKKVHEAYEGGYQRTGDIDDHPAYARFWPTWDKLQADKDFSGLTEILYRPLFAAAMDQEAFDQ